jgi:F0F1-type ATP synthase membrane subunit c/vacuolar-type H+-ATPase subunit K
VVKACSSTVEQPLILIVLSMVEVSGIYGVAVKCIDTIRNTDSEGSLLDRY